MRVKIVQQATDLTAIGGTTSEFNAMKNSKLNEKYEFVPMVLPKVHRKINLQDIRFYYRFIKREHPAIVQIRGAAVDGLNAQIAARLVPHTKILLCVHGMFSELVYINPLKKYFHAHILEPIIFQMCDGISCVYKNGEKRKQLQNYKRKMLSFVYNRMPQFETDDKMELREKVRHQEGISKEAVVGVFCGRFNREKGLSFLLQALCHMKQDWPNNFHVLMIGDGDYLATFQNELVRNDLQQMVHCLGEQRVIRPFLLASDFFIMPSLHENHSIALLEAIAAGLPTIATDVGGNGEIIKDGIEGVLVPASDSLAMEKAILQMCNSQTLREQYKRNITNNDYREFANDIVDEQLDAVYQQLLSR